MGKRKREDSDDDGEFKIDDESDDNFEDETVKDESFEVALEVDDSDDEVKEVKEPPKKKKKSTKTTEKKTTTKKAASKTKTKKSTIGKKPAKKVVAGIKSESEAKNVVFEYLKKQNRPYSVQNLVDNLHQQVKKKMCQTVVDKLVKEKKVTLKENGKSKLYFLSQDDQEVLTKEELQELDRLNRTLDNKKRELTSENIKLQSELSKTKKSLTNEELKKKIEDVKEEIQKKKEKLEKLRSGTELVTPQMKKESEKKLNDYIKLWKERKGIANDIVGMIADGLGVKPSKLYNDLDLETDEQHNVSYKELGQL